MNYARLLSPPPLLHSIYTVSFQTSFITELALWSTLVSFFFSLSLLLLSPLYARGENKGKGSKEEKKRERDACCIRWTWEHRKTIEWKFFFFIDSLTKFLQRKMLPGINSGISLVLFLLVTYIIVFVEFSSSNSSPGGNAPMEIIPVFFSFFFFDVIRVLTEILRYINSCLSLSLVKRRCELKDFFSNQIISRLNINYVRRKIGTPRIYLFCVVVK